MNDSERPETFFARRERLKETAGNGNGAGTPLTVAATAWPTPSASDHKGSGPTLERADGKLRGDRLDYAAEQVWNTPRATDGEKGGPNQAFGAGGTPLPSQAAQWSTPSVADTEGGRKARSGQRSDELLLNGQASALSSRQDPETPTHGEPSSGAGRKLNPLFVEWLMGWPPGWTLLCSTGSTDCGSWGMAWSLWSQRMRSELSQLVSPPAPPAQLSLFA